MAERSRSIDDMRGPYVSRLVEELWATLVKRVIDKFKRLPEDCRQSGPNSGLSDVWEEFKEQMRQGESIYFKAYEDTLRSFCSAEVSALGREQAALLWLWGEGFLKWEDEDDRVPFGQVLEENLEDELYGKVCSVACDEELAADAKEVEESPDLDDGSESGQGDRLWDGYISLDDVLQREAAAGVHFFKPGEKVTWRVQGHEFHAVIWVSSGAGFILFLDAAENERRKHLRGAHLSSFNLPESMWYATASELEPVKD